MHGFARVSQWQFDSARRIDDFVELRLTLDLPNHSNLRLLAQVGPRLNIELQVMNTSNTEFTFEEALHSYLAVSRLPDVFIHRLPGAPFIGQLDQMRRET